MREKHPVNHAISWEPAAENCGEIDRRKRRERRLFAAFAIFCYRWKAGC